MALLVSLVVFLVLIVILVVATLAGEIDRLPDDPANGRVPKARAAREGKRLVPLFTKLPKRPISGKAKVPRHEKGRGY
jgi:hypothetical protein